MTKRLLLLNGVAAFGVATYHAAAYGFSAMFEWTDRYQPVSVPNYDQIGSMAYYFLLLVRQLDAFVIPAFLFVSGFFIAFAARGEPATIKWDIVWARVKTLLPPLIIWTAIRCLLLRQPPSTIHDILRPYYFLVLLIQFYLLSPLIVRLAQQHMRLLLVGALLIQGSAESLFFLGNLGVSSPALEAVKSLLPLWFFPLRLFWFTVGVVAGFQRERLSLLSRYRWGLLVAVILMGSLTLFEYGLFARWMGQPWLGPSFRGLSSNLYALVFIFCFLAFENFTPPLSKQLLELGAKSLGIYLVNIPAIYVIAVLMYRWTPWLLGQQFLYQAVLISVGTALPLLLMELVRRSPARGYYRYLFG